MSNEKKIETKEAPNKSFYFNSIQELFSIGYVFLIICGMLLEYARYYSFDINVFQYSDFLDFLIVPFKNTALIPALVLFPLGIYWFFIKTKYFEKANQKAKKKNPEKYKELTPEQQQMGTIVFILCMGFSVVVGYSIATVTKSSKIIKRVESGKKTHLLHFVDGHAADVYVLGKNTNHIFYFENNAPEIIVSPIQGNISKIQFLKKKKNAR